MSLENQVGKCPYSDTLTSLIVRGAKALNKRMLHNFKEAGLEISLEQLSILSVLWYKDNISQQELSSMTERDKPCTTRLIDTMEKKGLLVRMHDPSDRRVKLIHITEKGDNLKFKVKKLIDETHLESLKGIDAVELKSSVKVLEQLMNNLI